jgi:hypothetical protein
MRVEHLEAIHQVMDTEDLFGQRAFLPFRSSPRRVRVLSLIAELSIDALCHN